MTRAAAWKLVPALMALMFPAVWPGPVHAAPASIGQCDAIRDADAYNRCIASFSPKHGAHRGPAQASNASRRQRRSATGSLLGKRDTAGKFRVYFNVGTRR